MKLKMFISVLILFLSACGQNLAIIQCRRDAKLDLEKQNLIINLCDKQTSLDFKALCIKETIESSCERQWVINHYSNLKIHPDTSTPCLGATKKLQEICYERGWDGN